MQLFLSVTIVAILSDARLTEGEGQPGSSLLENAVPSEGQKVNPRIVGGEEVTPHSYPFMVALVVPNNISAFCSGTLLTTSWVLTAAHCVSQKHDNLVLLFGAHEWTNLLSPTVTMKRSSSFVIHDNFSSDGLQNDIALVKLSEPVNLNKYIDTVKYAENNDSYVGEVGTLVGWGDTESNVSVALRKITSRILPNEECAAVNFKKAILSTNICVSGEGTVGTCTRDSGGPLLVNGVQVGIASFQYSPCTEQKPSVFTRITYYHHWIAQHIGDSSSSYNDFCYLLSLSIALSLLRLFNFS